MFVASLSSVVATLWTRHTPLGLFETELQLLDELSHLEREKGLCLHSGPDISHLFFFFFLYCFYVNDHTENNKAKKSTDELQHLLIFWLQGLTVLQCVSLLLLSTLDEP